MSSPVRRSIVLVGLMGTGKTTVGHILSRRLGRDYWDSDEVLRATGQSAAAIARDRGSAALHHLEAENLREAITGGGYGILGGAAGVVLESGMADLLRPQWVVWLRASVATVVARVTAHPDDRPFIGGAGDIFGMVAEMSRARAPLYAAVADQVVAVDDRDPEAVAERIVEELPDDLRAAGEAAS
jgi:shikimate kinase